MNSKSIFGETYADTYDVVYGSKDYEGECDRVLNGCIAVGSSEPRSVLDLGCGTGGHAIPFTRRGLRVVGVDRSAEMLAVARRKVTKEEHDIQFVHGDITDIDLGETFDLVTIMFAVLGYQLTDAAAAAALRTAARHLEPDGVLAFDVWWGPAVLSVGPERRTRTIEADGRRLARESSARIDLLSQIATVDINVRDLEDGSMTDESHEMRFFFPRELALLLGAAGLQAALLEDFDDPGTPPDQSTWNVLAFAKLADAASA
jgi:SAM-dependent methyltransferase